MASILNVPVPTSAPRQKSIDISDLFLTRFTPPWSRPSSLPAQAWRGWVLNQPVAVVCRETLIASLISLDWKITPRNSKYKEELEPPIKYYTRLFQNGGDYPGLGLDFSGLIEWVVGDLLDTPFGGAAEIGRKGGDEKGRVQWIRPLDAGTLFPTLNQDFPIVQYYPSYSQDVVVFKPWEVARVYMSPHSYLLREGWGMAPPEKVYFALDLLTKGDKYYANLLLDIPTAGILDLGDMEKSSAEEWISAFKSFVNDNTTSFKIPVLYEHNNKVEFIPFGKVPNDIMFNHITLKYAALVAAAYGMSLSDIGLQTTSASGETLAGSIRQERRTRKTGHARIKAKAKSFFDQILPETLEFNWIDYDDELNVAMGRARLATAQAFKTVKDLGMFSDQELRSQWIQDGLSSISMPDEIPPEAKSLMEEEKELGVGQFGKKIGGNTEPELIGNPKSPSSGGEGDVKRSFTYKSKPKVIANLVAQLLAETVPVIFEFKALYSEDDYGIAKRTLNESMFSDEDEYGLQEIVRSVLGEKRLVSLKLDEELKGTSFRGLDDFLMKSMVYHINDTVFSGVNDVDTMIQQISDKVLRSLDTYVQTYLQEEIQPVLKSKNLPEAEVQVIPVPSDTDKLISAVQEMARTPIHVHLPSTHVDAPTINVPQPVINVSVPERSVDVHVPEQKSEVVVNVPETVVNVSNNIPEQDTPIVHVNVPEMKSQAPSVIVNVPEQSAPVVNVNVEPTPIEVKNTVNVSKKDDKKKITLRKDGNTWTGESS
jgi:hypothetical protein